MAKSVVGLFESRNDAQQAWQEVQQAGFGGDNVTLVDQTAGSLGNLLVNAGIPQQDAALYANGVQQGGALLVAQALEDNDAYRIVEILDRHNTVDLSRRGQIAQQTTSTRQSSGLSAGNTNLYNGQSMVVPIIEEEIRIGKREVESGGVRVDVNVEEVPVNEQVTLREETVQVERRPVDRAVSQADLANLQTGTIEVREHDEQAVVSKEARVVEEVVIGKQVEQRTETIQDTVRRTDVDVEQIQGQTQATGFREVGGTSSTTTSSVSSGATTGGMTSGSNTGSIGGDEGVIERGASSLGNAAERATGLDLDRDGDTGQRDPRNNY